MRLSARQLNLTAAQMSRVEEGVNKANAKGIRDSLVLVDDIALVVNVTSKTVVTALGREQDNVFSNIDGAVIV
jgi:flagellar operon protein